MNVSKKTKRRSNETTNEDELKHLRNYAKSLERENSRLKKELGRYNSDSELLKETLEEIEFLKKPASKPVQKKISCPECSGSINNIQIGKITLHICQDCKYRRRVHT